MAYRHFPVRARGTRAISVLMRGVAALSLSALAFGASAFGTGGHRDVDSATELRPVALASLSFENDAPVITGTVASLFNTDIFAGPNRTQKTARVAATPDVVAFTQSFDALRLSIAEARATNTTYVSEQPAIAVASVDPAMLNAEGLRAIDAIAVPGLDPTVPRPVEIPATLAYGRSTTPATDFTPQHSWSEREQWCMATGIYFEARGESYRGQVAVAQVIMNRVEHENYPNTICGVVYQNQHRRNACQFSFACDGVTNVNRTPELSAWAQAQEITAEVLNGDIYLPEVANATHYHATYVRPAWARNMTRLTQIGLHVFYRFRPGWQFG